jgi:hypothetical protein
MFGLHTQSGTAQMENPPQNAEQRRQAPQTSMSMFDSLPELHGPKMSSSSQTHSNRSTRHRSEILGANMKEACESSNFPFHSVTHCASGSWPSPALGIGAQPKPVHHHSGQLGRSASIGPNSCGTPHLWTGRIFRHTTPIDHFGMQQATRGAKNISVTNSRRARAQQFSQQSFPAYIFSSASTFRTKSTLLLASHPLERKSLFRETVYAQWLTTVPRPDGSFCLQTL